MITEVSPYNRTTLDSNGNGQCGFGPPSGTKWALRLASVKVSTASAQPEVIWYRGSPQNPIELIDQSFTGAAASTGKVGGPFFYPGQWLWAVWSGGDPGATAELRAYGQQGGRSDPLAQAPLGEGAANSSAIIQGNELIVIDPATGTEVHIYVNATLGAVIDLWPPPSPAGTVVPAHLLCALNASNRPYLSLRSPQLNNAGFSEIVLSADELGNEFVELNGRAGITLSGPVTLFAGASDLSVQDNTVTFDSAGQLDMVNGRPISGNVNTTHGRGTTGVDYYTGGTGATSAGAVEAALPAWTNADDFRFKAGHLYSLHCVGGCFSSVTASNEQSVIRIRSAVNSTAAQQLGEARIPCPAGANVTTFDFTRYIQVGAADVDKTSLGLTVARNSGTGNHSIFGNAGNFPLEIRVKDEGQAADSQFANVAVTIT